MRFILLLTLVITTHFAWAGELEFRTLSAQEGGEFFSLQAGLTTTGDNSDPDDDYGYDRHNRGSTFDSVDITPYIKVSPPAKFSVSAKRSGFLLLGDFKPETNYKVTLKAGLSSKEGNRLAKDIVKEVQTGSLSPRFTFKSKARYLPGSMQGSLPWEAVNLDKVEFEVRQVYAQNFHQWLTTGEHASEYVSDAVKKLTVPIRKVNNRVVPGTFSLSDLETLGQGVFVITARKVKEKDADKASSGEGEGDEEGGGYYDSYQRTYDTATVIVTNLTIVAKRGAQGVKVWVVDTKSLEPVKGAQVDLVATSNRKLDQCKTSGSNAECTLSWKKKEDVSPYALIVRSGKDLSYVRFEDLALPNDTFHIGKREYSAASGGLDAYVYAERDLYRPGETVKMAAMVRNTGFEAVPKLPLRWTITNPRGKVVRESVSDTSELGIAQMEYPSSAAGDTGKYRIAVMSGKNVLHETSVLIEEFVPERVGLKVTPLQEVNVGKKQVQFNVVANYLFGPPVAKGGYKVSCSMKPAFTSIPGRGDYSTGIFSKEARQAVTLDAKEGTLDEKGMVKAVCGMDGGALKLAEAFELNAKVDVNEAGSGRATTRFGKAYVSSTDTLIGLKLESSTGRTIHVKGGLFDFKGGIKQAAKANLKVRLLNVREHYYYTSGGYDSWKVEEIISPTGVEKTIDASGAFDFSVDAPEGWGRWIVRAVDTKTGYTADLDAGYIGWWYNDHPRPGSRTPEPTALKVELSKREASPGDKVQAMIEAPFKGRVLFAFETDQTIESHWMDVDKPGPVKIELKVPEALPNVYVTALFLKTPQEGKRFLPARAWGAASIQVVPSAYRLDVKVVHPELNESRKTVTIQLSNAQKSAAEYSLAVVDEGILQMTDFKSPDPIKRFFEGRAMGVTSVETLGWTVAVDGDATKKPGGDRSGENAGKNMPVKLVSFYFPHVKSDSSGKAEVKVALPAFQGKVRVMAVASSKERMGSSSSAMTVRDPLVLQSTLPRFLTQGDKFQFPVSITNLSGKDQTVAVNIEAPGGLVALSSLKQTVKIADGKAAVLKFEADVKGVTGQAAILVTAASDDGKLKSEEKFELPVKPSGIEQTIRLSMDTKQEVQLAAYIPKDWRADYMRMEASVSPMPYLNQVSHLESLIHYPYGCIEQTTSATMPLLVMGDLLPWIESTKKVDKEELKRMINKGIARVASMQTASGGFGYWPGDGHANAWGTAYATNMLLDAKKLGYDVPAPVLKGALDYLDGFVRNASFSLISDIGYDEKASAPFAIYILAKSGRPVTAQLRDTVRAYNPVNFKSAGNYWKGLNAENYFLLSAAAKILGDSQTQKTLSDQSLYSIQLAGDVDDGYTYWSPMRSDGLRLSVLEDIAEKHPAVDTLAQRVAASLSKKDYYYSTQDIAWAVLALGKRMNGVKKLGPAAYAGTRFAVNDKPVAKSFEVMGAPGYQIEGPNLTSAKLKVSDAPGEKGVFLYVKATGYAKKPPVAKASSLKITRKFFRRDGSELDSSEIHQGETVFVELVVQNTGGEMVRNAAIVDRVPAGFEIENPRLGKSEEQQWMADPYKPEYLDLRDDRIQVFGDLNAGSTQSIFYSARAVTKGRFTAPASLVEAMYEPGNFDYDEDVAVQIVDAKK
jgi:uncharacterized protein YfaS (alpha-2-macroglobulin family)